MVEIDVLQKEIGELEKLAVDIEMRTRKLLTEAPKSSEHHQGASHKAGFYSYKWKDLPTELEPLQRDLTRDYQRWYSSASPFITTYISEKWGEFSAQYNLILNKIQLTGTASSTESMIASFVKEFEIQRSILISIPSVTRIKGLLTK